MSKVVDPLGARDYVGAYRRAYKAWRSKSLAAEHWAGLEHAFEALDITFPESRKRSYLAKQLLELGQACARGEFDVEDGGGVLMADRAMELAEALYAYAEGREESDDDDKEG